MKYLKRSEINDEKWDNCVTASTKPLIYALSWFLDAATNQHWDAIVWGDYEAVMPLPWNRKIGVKQVYSPFAIQRLGWFGKNLPLDERRNSLNLLEKFPQYVYAYQDNEIKLGEERINCLLPLRLPYEQLKSNYRSDRLKDLKRAKNLTIVEKGVDDYLEFFFSNTSSLLRELKADKSVFDKVYRSAEKHNSTKFWFSQDSHNNTISAVGFLFFDKRIHILSSATTKIGYDKRAFITLVDAVIKKYSNSNKILDFQGSSIKGIKEFNKSFGAIDEYYYLYTKQSKWVKKVKQIIGMS